MSDEKINHGGNKEALALWYKVTLQSIKSCPYDLSARQMAVLLTIYTQSNPHRVTDIAKKLGISKPPVSRAINTLSKYGLIKRNFNENDRRRVFIETTDEGYHFLGDFSDNVMNILAEI